MEVEREGREGENQEVRAEEEGKIELEYREVGRVENNDDTSETSSYHSSSDEEGDKEKVVEIETKNHVNLADLEEGEIEADKNNDKQ